MEKALLAFLQGVLETSGIVALSLALASVPLRWKLIGAAGTVLTLVVYAIRALPVAFGLHSIACVLLLVYFIAKTTRVSVVKSFIAVFTSFVTLALLELLTHEVFFALMNLDPQDVLSNYTLWKLLGLPQAVLLIILAIIVSKFKKPVQGAWKF